MVYVAAAKIKTYYTNLVIDNDKSIITTAKLDDLIATEEAIFNSFLSKLGYETVPLTAATDLLMARKYIEWRVVCEVDGILRESDLDTAFDFKRNLCKKAKDLYDKLKSNEIIFSEWASGGSVAFANNVDTKGNKVDPYFTIDRINRDISFVGESETDND